MRRRRPRLSLTGEGHFCLLPASVSHSTGFCTLSPSVCVGRLWRIRPLLDRLNHNFLKYGKPSTFVTLDEMMVAMSGSVFTLIPSTTLAVARSGNVIGHVALSLRHGV